MAYRDMDGLDGPVMETLAGPLIGGGTTQVGSLATRLIWKDNPDVTKWSPAIGLGLGAIVGGILAFRPQTRSMGIAALVTAALVALPRQLENLMEEDAGTTEGFGIITPEHEMMGLGAGVDSAVELLGDNGMGIVTPEQGMGQSDSPVELLGNGGFGTNFLS